MLWKGRKVIQIREKESFPEFLEKEEIDDS